MSEDTMEKFQPKKGFKSALIFNVVLILGVTIYTLFSGNSGSVMAQVNEEALGVAGGGVTVFVQVADISEAELVDTVDFGTPQQEIDEESKVYSGKYENSEFGVYDLCVYKDSEHYIVVHHSDGVLVYSLKSDKLTQESYEELVKALE